MLSLSDTSFFASFFEGFCTKTRIYIVTNLHQHIYHKKPRRVNKMFRSYTTVRSQHLKTLNLNKLGTIIYICENILINEPYSLHPILFLIQRIIGNYRELVLCI